MLPIYICEDNAQQRTNIEALIKKRIMIEAYDMAIEKATDSPAEIVQAVQQNKTAGIYFLDIELNDVKLAGFELAQTIRKLDSNGYIIFVTTHEELAFQTFHYKVAALEYILKDEPDKMAQSVADCLQTIQNQLSSDQPHKKILQIVADEQVLLLDETQITFFEVASSHKIIVHSLTKRINFNGDLKAIEPTLPANFIRCHRSFIVNLNYIETIDKRQNLIYLKNGAVCYISRRKVKGVLAALAEFTTV